MPLRKSIVSLIFLVASFAAAQTPFGLFTWQGGGFAPNTNGLLTGALGYVPRPGYAYCEPAPGVWTPCTSAGGGGLPAGLLEEWPSNEGVGTYLRTLSASGDALTATAVTWAASTGFPGYVAQYNGTSSGSVGANQTNTNFTGATPFSACVWIDPTTYTPSDQGLISTIDLATGAISGWDMELATGGPRVYLVNNVSTNVIDVFTVVRPTIGAANLVCFTYDGSRTAAGTLIYINGVAVGKTVVSDTLTGSIVSAQPVVLGARHSGSNLISNFSGALGYAAIYSQALSAGTIAAMYTAGPR